MKRKTQDPRIAKKVIEMVATHYKTTPDALKDSDGDRTARQVIMYILKEELGGTLRVAREAINIKADMTVYTACTAIKALLKTDKALATAIEEIKTEALMIATTSGGESNTPTTRSEVAPVAPSNNTAQIINNVRKAVTSVFLGPDLLQSPDPGAEVVLAKDAVVFLVWDDFPKIPLTELLSIFHLDQDGLYKAVGRISVAFKEDENGFKKKLKAARAGYMPS